jgi:hypothetical protein
MVVDDEHDLTLYYKMSLKYYDLRSKHSIIQKEHCPTSNQIIMI